VKEPTPLTPHETPRPPSPSVTRSGRRPPLTRRGRHWIGEKQAPRSHPGWVGALAVATVVVTAVTAYLWSVRQDPIYGAQAEFLFSHNETASFTDISRLVDTQTVILRSRRVLAPVAELADTSVESINESLSVEIVGQTNVLRLTMTDPNARAAERVAQAIVDNYVQGFSDEFSVQDQEAMSFLRRRIKEVSTSLKVAEARLDESNVRRSQEQRLSVQVTDSLQQLSSLQDQLVELQLERHMGPSVEVVTPAHLLPEPLKPNPLQSAGVGVLAGLVIAGGGLLTMAHLRSRE
jgi:uncharacterized protein involved in exopolysaccharide biosynthesis